MKVTVRTQLMALFPTLVVGLAAASALWALFGRSLLGIAALLFVLYGLPLVAWRWHQRRFPLVEGASHLVGGPYSPWFGGHQIQLVYIAFPVLETALRLVPGLFSAWLRAWGSNIGRSVYWTPHFRLGDRSLLEVGDEVIFGYDVGVSGHLIKKTRKNVLLYVKRVSIGEGAFIGAGAILGPGVVVEPGANVEAGEHVYPRTRVKKDRPAPKRRAA